MAITTRRAFLGGMSLAALSVLGGRAARAAPLAPGMKARPVSAPFVLHAAYDEDTGHYGAVTGEPFPVPAIDLSKVDPAFLRKVVDYQGPGQPGSIIIDPRTRYLHLILDGGQAIRYGVGVGREGFGWSGNATIHDKQEWPDWYPPKEMLARQPEIMRVMHNLQGGLGMPGGPGNPLGARAMYLWQGNKDTLYRIHGTIEPWTIGKRVSSGCIRMINQDAMDLYERVAVGTPVTVLGGHDDEVIAHETQEAPPRPARQPLRLAPDPYGQGVPAPQYGSQGYASPGGAYPYRANPYQSGTYPYQGGNYPYASGNYPYQGGNYPYAHGPTPYGNPTYPSGGYSYDAYGRRYVPSGEEGLY